MKFPNYCPNLRIVDLLKACLIPGTEAEEKIKEYFKALTNKKFILLTNSCRTALYLTYMALDKKGEVITTPLTCDSSILPINDSGNNPVFADITMSDLNINPEGISSKLTNDTVALHVIHHGGVSCKMDKLTEIAKSNKLIMVEDCAQSLGAEFKGVNTGSFGDFSCFSLIKNSYGIGGGVFATNSETHFQRVCELNDHFRKPPAGLIMYRLIRNIIQNRRNSWWGGFLYDLIISLRGKRINQGTIKSQLARISGLETKIAAHQMIRYPELHNKRKLIGKQYYNLLNSKLILVNNDYDPITASFTKFFLYNPSLESREVMGKLKKIGIEVMHLEQKHGSPVQERVISEKEALKLRLVNYNKVHDHIISLPLAEQMTGEQVGFICNEINKMFK